MIWFTIQVCLGACLDSRCTPCRARHVCRARDRRSSLRHALNAHCLTPSRCVLEPAKDDNVRVNGPLAERNYVAILG